jgi:hypothetical protein
LANVVAAQCSAIWREADASENMAAIAFIVRLLPLPAAIAVQDALERVEPLADDLKVAPRR